MTGPQAPPGRVAVVAVSHSAALAAGVAEVAAQMAPETTVIGVGGSDDGGLGTSFDAITDALLRADGSAGSVVLYDLGSARLTSETAVEFLEPDVAARIEIVDAPLVEGALAAAVTAQGGADRATVAAAAREATGPARVAGGGLPEAGTAPPEAGTGPPALTRSVVLRNPLGLHARPVAELIARVAGLDAQVQIARPGGAPVDLRSLLAVVSLALRGGDTAAIRASGAGAVAAVDRVTELIESGFGEAGPAAGSAQPSAPATSVAPASQVPAPAASVTSAGPAATEPAPLPPAGVVSGTPGAPGRAIGPRRRVALPDVPDRPGAGPDTEGLRLDDAIAAAATRLAAGDAMSRAHAALVGDPQLRDAAAGGLSRGLAAAPAWWQAVTAVAGQLAASPDELVAARAADVREAGAAVLAELGEALDRIPLAGQLRAAVLTAHELGPGEVARAAERGAVAVVLAGGSPTAHAVLVARNLGLPLVLGTGPGLDAVADGVPLDVDGTAGTVQADPPDLAGRQREIAAAARRQDRARARAAGPVRFRGRPIRVSANVGSVAEARAAVAAGADGVGLLRTELLLPDGPRLPGEDEQVALLAAVLDVLGDRPVAVRVLDVGGDKPLRALALDPQRNGFLGIRGLRWLLRHRDVLHTQLRAICRAAGGHHVEVMAPMVTLAGEIAQFRAAVRDALDSLAADGTEHGRPVRIGAMIEVPAAALTAAEIGAVADFVSLGTNDLIAYTMAADRAEPGVAALADPAATAVWRIIGQACQGAARAGTDVAVCGELAADERFAVRLAALGVTELSMAAGRIPAVKTVLRAAGPAAADESSR